MADTLVERYSPAYKKKKIKNYEGRHQKRGDGNYQGQKAITPKGWDGIAAETDRKLAMSANKPQVYRSLMGNAMPYKAQTSADIEKSQPGLKKMREERQTYISKQIKKKKKFANSGYDNGPSY